MQANHLTVLVVDDELPLRQEMRLFPWEENQAELIGEAENGEQALEFCRNYCPDVVITDITMPLMDGLALSRTLKQEFPLTQVILLTCHSEFAYAQEALQLGVLAYLVKLSMEEEDVRQVLNKARKAIHHEQSHLYNERAQMRWKLSLELIRMSKQAHAPTVDSQSIMQQFAAFGWKFNLPSRLVRLHIDARKEDRMFVNREIETTLTQLEQPNMPFVWIPVGDENYLLLFLNEENNTGYLRTRLERIMKCLTDTLDAHLSFVSEAVRIYSIISDTIRSENDFPALYRDVCQSHISCFYDGSSSIFIGQSPQMAPLADHMLAGITEKLRKAQWRPKPLISFIRRDFYDWALKMRIVPDELKNLVIQWRVGWLKDGGPSEAESQCPQRIMAALTLNELIATIIHDIETRSGSKNLRKELMDAKQLINDKLASPITLASISNEIGLSPHYFSRLFREEVGESFNEYVTRQRMEKAALLLQNTCLKVYEVADRVGIPSYRYFSAIFRKWTGVAPTDFKKG